MTKRTTHLHDVAYAIRRDGIAIVPCDTILGLVGRLSPEVFRRLNLIKNRDPLNPFLVLVPNASFIPQLATDISAAELQMMDQYWPGPVTLLLNRNERVDASLFPGTNRLGVRWPAYHPLNHLLALVKEPVFSTSVNLTGVDPAKRYEDIPWSIEKEVDMVFMADPIPTGPESTLVEIVNGKINVLRGVLREPLEGI